MLLKTLNYAVMVALLKISQKFDIVNLEVLSVELWWKVKYNKWTRKFNDIDPEFSQEVVFVTRLSLMYQVLSSIRPATTQRQRCQRKTMLPHLLRFCPFQYRS